VLIATDGPIDESPSITKSLTLAAAPGYQPLFSASDYVKVDFTGPLTYAIEIDGLAFEAGSISVSSSPDAAYLTATIRNNSFAAADGVGVYVGASGGSTGIDVSGNTIQVPADDKGVEVFLGGQTSAIARVADNWIIMSGGTLSLGIDIDGVTSGGSSADVIANRIVGEGSGYSAGILVEDDTGYPIAVNILDNLVFGQGGREPNSGAIVLAATGALNAAVANNTVAYGDVGIRAIAGGSGSFTGIVANNIVSSSSQLGIDISDTYAVTLPNRNNLLFANVADNFTPGPGTVTADPLYVGSGDFHLQPSSPAIDAGNDTAVPTDLTTDLDGNPRIQGAHVDIGAYEVPEPGGILGAAASLAALAALKSQSYRARLGGTPMTRSLSR
jgi:hypothetical protein